MKKRIKLKDSFLDLEADKIARDVYKIEINDKDYFFIDKEGELEPILKDQLSEMIEKDSNYTGESLDENTNDIKAPLTGTISSIWVKLGDKVKKGQKVITLIAMKMENEITASCDGVVEKISVKKDQVVNKGDILLKLK